MYYVGNPDYASANQNFVPNQVLVESLKAYRDNRLFAYCDLNGYKGDREGDPDSFDSYFGVPFGLASPDADKQYNVANAEAAIRTYLNGDGSRWQRVWWDVADND